MSNVRGPSNAYGKSSRSGTPDATIPNSGWMSTSSNRPPPFNAAVAERIHARRSSIHVDHADGRVHQVEPIRKARPADESSRPRRTRPTPRSAAPAHVPSPATPVRSQRRRPARPVAPARSRRSRCGTGDAARRARRPRRPPRARRRSPPRTASRRRRSGHRCRSTRPARAPRQGVPVCAVDASGGAPVHAAREDIPARARTGMADGFPRTRAPKAQVQGHARRGASFPDTRAEGKFPDDDRSTT